MTQRKGVIRRRRRHGAFDRVNAGSRTDLRSSQYQTHPVSIHTK